MSEQAVLELSEVRTARSTLSEARRPILVSPALRGVSLTVGPSEIVGLLGTPSSGKSAVIRVAAGLLRPVEGQVRVLGADPMSDGAIRSQIGVVLHEDRSFWRALSVRENLRLAARLYGLSGEQAEARMESALHETSLEPLADRAVEGLGGAARQRLAVARALLPAPRLLLLDEASSGLDASRRDAFYTWLAERVQREKIAVLFATHALIEAQYLCQRTVLLDEGRVVAEGSYLEVEPQAEALFRRYEPEGDVR